MTESDIYQLVGKAYCAGLNEGMDKAASSADIRRTLAAIHRSIPEYSISLESFGGAAKHGLYKIRKTLAEGKLLNLIRMTAKKPFYKQDDYISRIAAAINNNAASEHTKHPGAFSYAKDILTNLVKNYPNGGGSFSLDKLDGAGLVSNIMNPK